MLENQNSLRQTIKSFKADLESDADNQDMTKWQLARAYTNLARWETPAVHYGAAAHIFSELISKHPVINASRVVDYYNDASIAYLGLAEFEDAEVNLALARQYAEKALDSSYTSSRHKTGIIINLSSIHIDLATLADSDNTKHHLHEAIRYSLMTINNSQDQMQVVYAKDNLVQAYERLAKIDEDVSLLNKAIEAMKETVEFFTSRKKSTDYAIAMVNYASLHITLAQQTEALSDWEEAERVLNDSLITYQNIEDRLNSTLILIEILNAKRHQAQLMPSNDDSVELYKEVINQFKEIDFSVVSDYHKDVANAHEYVGICWLEIARILDSMLAKYAIQHLVTSIEERKLSDTTYLALGNTYLRLGYANRIASDRKNAKKAFDIAKQCFEKEERSDLVARANDELKQLSSPLDWLRNLLD